MSASGDRAKIPIRHRHDPLKWMADEERTETFVTRLTLAQQRAIAKDTRLPGEIACTYKTTAAVIVRVQQVLRRRPPA
jgi:hypothetical protein